MKTGNVKAFLIFSYKNNSDIFFYQFYFFSFRIILNNMKIYQIQSDKFL